MLFRSHQFTSVIATTNGIAGTTFNPLSPIIMMALVDCRHKCMTVRNMSTTTTTTEGNPQWSSHHKHFPLPNAKGFVIYTETDEAPALATYSLYPVVSKVRNKIYIFMVVHRLVASHQPYSMHVLSHPLHGFFSFPSGF